jgi:phosphatidate cytidylyltransferase
MLRQRVLTAIAIVVPVFLLIVFGSSRAFALLALLVIAIGAWEWGRLVGFASGISRGLYTLAIPALAGLLLLFWEQGGWSTLHAWVLALASLWWLGVFVGLLGYQPGLGDHGWGRFLLRVAGFFTLVPAAVALVWLHAANPHWLLYLLFLVAAADTGAYFAGRRFGRTRLAPEISPGKTREGVFGALIAVILVATVAAWLFGLVPMDALLFVLLSVVVALVSVAGDLQESILKREAGAKDSGTLLPGHGGVLDRVDSLTAAAPVFVTGLLWASLQPGGL